MFSNLALDKYLDEESVFLPENLLREARSQKNIKDCSMPKICTLDPDGDIVRYLKKHSVKINDCWAYYHSQLFTAKYRDLEFESIGCGVGAAYVVLLAEQLFVSGCELLISKTSAGKVNESIKSDYLLIKDSIRDEGNRYHYLAAGGDFEKGSENGSLTCP